MLERLAQGPRWIGDGAAQVNARDRLAHHEAAHVVSSLWERIPVESSTIVPNEHGDGATWYRDILYGRNLEGGDASTSNRLRMERLARGALAGPAASRRLGDARSDATAPHGGDEAIALDMIRYFTATRRETEAYYKLLEIQAEQFLEKPGVWAQIVAVAEALLAKETLTGKQIRDIASRARREAMKPEPRRLAET